MASGLESDGPKPGTTIAVEVEQAVNNVLMVCMRIGGKTYRGALIDTQNGKFPHSICDRLKDNFDIPVNSENEAAVVVMPGEDIPGEGVHKGEHSALSYRQSYFQNMPLPAPRPLLLNRPANFKEKAPSTNTRTRPVRLRPRRLLCSKCRSQCAGNASQSVCTPVTSTGGKGGKLSLIRKQKKSANNPPKHNAGSKNMTGTTTTVVHKTSPAIKISYASPQGKGHVVRIPAKSHSNFRNSATVQNVKNRPGDTAQASKSQLKSRTVAKGNKTKPIHNGFLHGNGPKSYFEQHRRIRIIKSKGTYHSATSSPSVNLNEIASNNRARNKSKSMVAFRKVARTAAADHLTLPLCKRDCLEDKLTPDSETQEVYGCVHDLGRSCSPNSETSLRSASRTDETVTDSIDSRSTVDGTDNKPANARKDSQPNGGVHKKNVTRSQLQDGREMCIGDIVWGKIIGFPWWPGRIVEIVVSRHADGKLLNQLAQITWFASTTISHMPLADLYPFLQFFTERYSRKKKGVYRDAVRQATEAATTLSAEVRALNTMFETSSLQP